MLTFYDDPMSPIPSTAAAIARLLSDYPGADPLPALHRLQQAGLTRLPLPGAGATLARWQAFATVGAHDLALAKLYEGHLDAVAILHEAGLASLADNGLWGTWCAEPPDARVAFDGATLSGRKAWCSGAANVSHAVVSCWNNAGAPCLAAVAMDQPGVTVTDAGWQAVGMAGSRSVDVVFDLAVATPVGAPGCYVERPGFWHGGAGVAACWYGAAQALAAALHASVAERSAAGQPVDAHRLAQLGEVDVALQTTAALMRAAAAQIDAAPFDNGMARALRVRLAVEACAGTVLHAVGRALGAGPLCKDGRIARLYADLPVFLRQSHAERDLATLGRAMLAESTPWQL